MTAAMELLQLAVPKAARRVSPENTVSPTAPNANYAPPEHSATKQMPLRAKLAKNVQEAPTQSPKVCLPKPSVQNVRRVKQVAKQAKVQKPPDVLIATPESTPKIQVKRDAKTAQQVLRPKALRIAAHAQPDLF